MSSVRSEIVVDAPAERAFRVFTEKMATWWPATHHIGATDMKGVVLDPRPKGRWAEVDADGKETQWGHVLVFDPPKRLVLAWQLNSEWAFDPKLVTEVEVNFSPAGEGRTRVALEHRNLERFGALEEQVKKSVGSEGGWALLLREFAKAASAIQEPKLFV
jgi:uncharacterized protein YndB with AHSA1/START domain